MKHFIFRAYISCVIIATCLSSSLHARDINLDSLYINGDSNLYARLIEKKVEAYQKAGSQFIDRDVIFSCWGDGNSILYVKELPRLNVIYSFNRASRRTIELFRIQGTITAFKNSASGRYLFIKRLVEGENSMPRGETQVLDLSAKSAVTLESTYPFLDFSVAPGGNTILVETKDGIAEYFPESGRKVIVLYRKEYADIIQAGSPVIAVLSPNRKKIVVASGSGGAYQGKVISSGRSWRIPGMTSASELYWVDNALLVYRKGYAGNFSVHLYDTTTQRSTELLGNSLNTNIQFSVFPKMISFLQDQVIHAYDVRHLENITIGLEGEDVIFSPDGNRFISLYLKKLFVTSVTTVKSKNIELAKTAKEIIALYRNLLDARGSLANEYSPEYIRKKISVYSRIAE
ncbi:MAG: hypothetical protein KA369_02020 [Spirochaetes bacterium]|nr:hypothetical protein [Spirochaetota bacterium]